MVPASPAKTATASRRGMLTFRATLHAGDGVVRRPPRPNKGGRDGRDSGYGATSQCNSRFANLQGFLRPRVETGVKRRSSAARAGAQRRKRRRLGRVAFRSVGCFRHLFALSTARLQG